MYAILYFPCNNSKSPKQTTQHCSLNSSFLIAVTDVIQFK
jgi:hypothetical protein